jgi:hypothetical protein
MITEDEAMKLFARADPAHADETSSDVDVSSALEDLRRRSTAPTVVEITATTDRPTNGHHWRIITAAVAAAVVVVAGALMLVATDDTTDPASDLRRAVRGTSATTTSRSGRGVRPMGRTERHAGAPASCYTAAGTTASALTCYGLIRNDAGPGFSSVLVATAVLGDPDIDTFTRVSIGEQSDETAPTTTAS